MESLFAFNWTSCRGDVYDCNSLLEFFIGCLKIWLHHFYVDATIELNGCAEGQVCVGLCGVSCLHYPVPAVVQDLSRVTTGSQGGTYTSGVPKRLLVPLDWCWGFPGIIH